MANRFWVGDGGNWSDNTNHWAASTGGAPNETKPTSSDNVYFDANSFSSGSQTVTINEVASCLDMDWSNVTNTPTLAGGSNIVIHGSLTFVSGMTVTKTGQIRFEGTVATSKTCTTGGLDLTSCTHFLFEFINGDMTLQDAVTCSIFYFSRGVLDLNGQTITCTRWFMTAATSKTLTAGAAIINITAVGLEDDATVGTFDYGTSTIKIIETDHFKGNGRIYNNVELNGTAHTISGSNTFTSLKIGRAAAVTITGTAGTTQTVRHFFATNNANVLTMVSTGAAWTLTGNSGYCELDYTDLTNVVAGYANIYYAGDNSTDGTGNTNWIFSRKVRLRRMRR
ncbi:hypothetical protein LCGC14_2163820 [marine sediment metagenome]|uniref:G8 domain-containing protein n=1 Tax=marine sediment metagenome TaxID=412755 RepID=A0A0F9G4P9_9ZZZZ